MPSWTRILLANVRHFYQHRGLWPYYYMLIFFSWRLFALRPTEQEQAWFWYVNINLMAGLVAGTLQREVLSKPFTYCLPGHRFTPRRLIIAIGVVLNIVLSLSALVRRDLAGLEAIPILYAAFFAGLATYLVTVRCMFTLSERILPGLIVVTVLMGMLFVRAPAIDDLVRRDAGLLMAVAVVVCTAIWANLGGGWARKFCGQTVLNISDFSRVSLERNRRIREANRVTRCAESPSWVESSFLSRMNSSPRLSTTRCVWGELYIGFAGLLSRWRALLLSGLAAALLLSYAAAKMRLAGMGELASTTYRTLGTLLFFPVIVVCLILAVQMPIRVFSSMVLTRGRRERFAAMLSIAVALTLLMSLSLMFVTVCTAVLQYIAPARFASLAGLFGGAITAVFLALPFALVPFGLATRLVGQHLNAAIIYGLVFCIFLLIRWVDFWFEWVGIPFLVVASLFCWGLLVFTAHYVATYKRLAG
jgi:hypothetical protein